MGFAPPTGTLSRLRNSALPMGPREALIEGIERQLSTTHDVQRLFTIRWTVR